MTQYTVAAEIVLMTWSSARVLQPKNQVFRKATYSSLGSQSNDLDKVMHPVCNESEAAKNIDFWGHKWHQDRRKTETGASFIDVPGFWSTTSDAVFYGKKRIADVKSQQIPSERPENGRSYFTFPGASN